MPESKNISQSVVCACWFKFMQQCTRKIKSFVCLCVYVLTCIYFCEYTCVHEVTHNQESRHSANHQYTHAHTDTHTETRTNQHTHPQILRGHRNPAGLEQIHKHTYAHTLPSSWFFSSSCDSSCLRRSSTLPWRSSACRGRYLHISTQLLLIKLSICLLVMQLHSFTHHYCQLVSTSCVCVCVYDLGKCCHPLCQFSLHLWQRLSLPHGLCQPLLCHLQHLL